MTLSEATQLIDQWQPYELDHHAQKLVLENRDKKDVLNESHKMRMTVAYGLERFWGEYLRLEKERGKSAYWKSVWHTLGEILAPAGIDLPGRNLQSLQTTEVKAIAQQLWGMPMEQRRVALMVLTQLCDALVWWTQRYKIKS